MTQSFATSTATMTVTRKRPKIHPQQFGRGRTPANDLTTSVSSLDLTSPSPLANTDYFLAGGMDTPGAWSEHRLERAQEADAEQDYRPSRYSQRPPDLSFSNPSEMNKKRTFSGLDSINGRSSSDQTWQIGKTAWALTGGLAGKIFNFCWTTTFNGFQAGGGQAYTNNAEGTFTTSAPTQQDSFLRQRRNKIPGSFPRSRESLEAQESLDMAYDNDLTSRSCLFDKQISEDSAVKNSWVFVEHSQSPHLQQQQDHETPVRKRSRASIASTSKQNPLQQSFPNPRRQPPTATFTNTTSTTTASFASPRSRTTSSTSLPYTTSTSNNISTKRPRSSLLVSPQHSHHRRQSSHPTIPQHQNQQHQAQSPISPEISSYQRKKRKEDKRADESLRRLNAALRDMIREGQQALGAKVEVVTVDGGCGGHAFGYGDVMDEGFFDEDD